MARKTIKKNKSSTQTPKMGSSEQIKSSPLDDLKMIRIYDFNLIPRYLFEQIKGRQWEVDSFLKIAPGIIANPTTLLYIYADKDHVIQGFLWASVNIFTGNIDGQMLSLSRKYWGCGAVLHAVNFLKNVIKLLKLNKITFRTSRVKAFVKHGAKPSPSVVMEF